MLSVISFVFAGGPVNAAKIHGIVNCRNAS